MPCWLPSKTASSSVILCLSGLADSSLVSSIPSHPRDLLNSTTSSFRVVDQLRASRCQYTACLPVEDHHLLRQASIRGPSAVFLLWL
uniref:Secreted protein n=1 Tax=Rhipicephalus appendiculatus TaxID=34631 RepID=A0A131YEW1_RHIAP